MLKIEVIFERIKMKLVIFHDMSERSEVVREDANCFLVPKMPQECPDILQWFMHGQSVEIPTEVGFDETEETIVYNDDQ